MAGNKNKYFFAPSGEETALLNAVAASSKEKKIRRQRAQILLMRMDRASYAQIREQVGVSLPTIAKTVRKCSTLGVAAALDDLARSGRPARIPDDAKDWVVGLSRKQPKDVDGAPDGNAWSISILVDHVRRHCLEAGHPSLANVQRSSVWNWIRQRGNAEEH